MFEGETTGTPSLASLREGWGPFCRWQRPDGRPKAVPVRRRRSHTGIDSRAKEFLPPQNKNYYAKIQGIAASEPLRCRDIFFVEMLWTGLYRLWMKLISETGKNSDTELAMQI